MSDTIDLSVCVVNHRTPELTRDCLRSIAETRRNLAVEVLLVNNTPDVCEVSDVAADMPFTFIQNDAPNSFAHNQNKLMALARGRLILSLNSDTIVHEGTLTELIAFMDAHPRCGLAGPRLQYPDGRLQPSCRTFPNALTSFLEASSVWRLLRPSRMFRGWFDLLDPHDQAREVDWLSGACLVVRREVVASVGGYDEAMFAGMYGEDLEWAWRIRRAGWSVWFDPTATVTHLESKSPVGGRAVKVLEGTYIFARANYGRSRQLAVELGNRAGYFLRWISARDRAKRQMFASLVKHSL